MPDAARLTAAACLALLAFILSGMIMPLMPDDTDFGYFTVVNIVVGFLVGWVLMGRRAGNGFSAAITNGLTGALALVFWGLFVQGGNEMLRLAMRNYYDGPFEAIFAIFEHMVEFGAYLLNPVILVTLAVGGALSGLATDYAWKRWP